MTFRSIWSGSFYIFAILVIGTILGLGTNVIYMIYLSMVLLFLLQSSRVFYFPKALSPLAFMILTLIMVSYWFCTSVAVNTIYSMLYLSSLLTVLFAYRFPLQSVHMILWTSCALSGLIAVGFVQGGPVANFLISLGIDSNFTAYFLVSGIFVLLKYNLTSKRVRNCLVILMISCGVLLMSRSFLLMLGILFIAIYWDKSRIIKVTIASICLAGVYLLNIFVAENPLLLDAIYSALIGELNFDDLVEDKRRVGLLATAVGYIIQVFPNGSGLGPPNYLAAILSEGLSPSESFRLGYAHNYYISIVAQVGLMGFFFLLYLLRIAYSSLYLYPIIATICVGLVFNEFIGVPVLWLFIGLYFNANISPRRWDNDLEVLGDGSSRNVR